jgi:hypothetical protein
VVGDGRAGPRGRNNAARQRRQVADVSGGDRRPRMNGGPNVYGPTSQGRAVMPRRSGGKVLVFSCDLHATLLTQQGGRIVLPLRIGGESS